MVQRWRYYILVIFVLFSSLTFIVLKSMLQDTTMLETPTITNIYNNTSTVINNYNNTTIINVFNNNTTIINVFNNNTISDPGTQDSPLYVSTYAPCSPPTMLECLFNQYQVFTLRIPFFCAFHCISSSSLLFFPTLLFRSSLFTNLPIHSNSMTACGAHLHKPVWTTQTTMILWPSSARTGVAVCIFVVIYFN